MIVEYLYPDDSLLIAKHVNMLEKREQKGGERPDIVHVHGCWNHEVAKQAMSAHRKGARIVLSPHGGLEPWVVEQRQLSERLAGTLLWQRRLVECCYVLIAHGNMEAEALRQLGWNPRIETIRNAVITNSITPEAMSQHTQEVYRKVMDSNTLELMSDEARQMLAMLLKAGITGDRRWVEWGSAPPDQKETWLAESEWRRLLIYAEHENVRTVVDAGCRVMGVHQPFLETKTIGSYLPTDYQQPRVSAHDVAGIVAETRRAGLTLRHLTELDRALRRDDVQDDRLTEALDESHLLKYFRRLLQVMSEVTLLDEGFMPAQPLDDRKTQRIRNLLYNHLRI